jgi:hypothetical protein
MIRGYLECVGPCIAGLGVMKGRQLDEQVDQSKKINNSAKALPTVYCFLPYFLLFL